MEVNVGGGGRGARGGGLTTKITRGVGVGAEGEGSPDSTTASANQKAIALMEGPPPPSTR